MILSGFNQEIKQIHNALFRHNALFITLVIIGYQVRTHTSTPLIHQRPRRVWGN